MKPDIAAPTLTISCFLASVFFYTMGKGELGGLSHRQTAIIFLALGIIGLILLF